jgi:hypothetical protein
MDSPELGCDLISQVPPGIQLPRNPAAAGTGQPHLAAHTGPDGRIRRRGAQPVQLAQVVGVHQLPQVGVIGTRSVVGGHATRGGGSQQRVGGSAQRRSLRLELLRAAQPNRACTTTCGCARSLTTCDCGHTLGESNMGPLRHFHFSQIEVSLRREGATRRWSVKGERLVRYNCRARARERSHRMCAPPEATRRYGWRN